MKSNQNKKYYINEKLSSFKLSLSYITLLLGSFDENKEDPDEPLLEIVNYDDIKKISKLEEKNNIKNYFYLGRKKIAKLLYDQDEVIIFEEFPEENLSSYFYLSLLIKENRHMVNYQYTLKYIQSVFNKMKEIDNKAYKTIILSNIILDMIKAYKYFQDYNEENEKAQLDKIEDKTKKIISENIKSIKPEFELKDIESKNIEEIYIKIIKYLLTNISEDLSFILEQLDIKNINITSTIFGELSKSLSDKDFTKNYIIIELNDLEDEKIINFYYILLIYVLKDPLYIYQNNFLLQIKRKIINIFKTKSIDLYNLLYNNNTLNNDNLKKLNDIINFFADSKYYHKKYIESIKNNQNQSTTNYSKINNTSGTNSHPNIDNLNNLLDNNSNGNSSSKIDSSIYREKSNNSNNIIKIKDDISESKDIINKILNDSSFIFEINEKNKFKFIINKEIKIGNKILKYEDMKKLKISESDTNSKDYEKFLTIFDDFKNSFVKKIDIKNSLKIVLNFKKENKIENLYLNFINENKNNKLYTIRDILNIKSLSNEKEFLDLISGINDYITTKTNNKNSNISSINSISEPNSGVSSINFIQESNSSHDSFVYNNKKNLKKEDNEIINTNSDKYKIIDIVEIIGIHKKESEYIKEYSNRFLISADSNNNLFIYDSNYRLVKLIEEAIKDTAPKCPKKWPLSIYQKNNSSDGTNEKLELIACSKIGVLEINYNIINNTNTVQAINNTSCSVYFNVGENDYIIGGEKGIFHYKNGNSINNPTNAFRGGIKINKDIIAFTSNSILPDGKDDLIFYSIKEDKNILTKKMNYSFTISTNSLSLMTCQENKCEVLLCGCKKYCKNQKNGILLINLNLPIYPEEFMDLGNFEVYCFCPISIINDDKNNSMEKTNYFLVGGFDTEKLEGAIKLFKIKKMKNFDNKVVIEYIQDIEFEKKKLKIKTQNKKKDEENTDQKEFYIFYGFERTISSIIQSKINGKILITSWDGYDYLCNTPNIKYYLEKDKKRKEENKNKQKFPN